jgi:AcrR family transcriptional regulator
MATTLRKQREVRQRELHLLEAARRMLVAHGYAGLSMDRLAEATEYSKGTIYQHFSTKEDLVMALASQSMEQRTSLFDRVARFDARPRERMHGVGIADELFARLYPYSFRSELIIKMADLEDRASPERRELLQAHEDRCAGLARGFIEDAIRIGDLDPATSVSRVMFAIMSMVIGTHTMTSSFCSLMTQTGIVNPFSALRDNIQVLLDGFGWKPLSTEWDYAATTRRITKEVFADECQTAGLG